MSRAHSGPVFAMFTCLEDGLIVTAGKETGRGEGGEEGGGGGGGGGGGRWGTVQLWSADMSQSRSLSLGQPAPVVVRSVCRSKVWYGMVWYGTVRYGMVMVRYGMVMVWYGMVRYGYGMVWYGMV